MSNPWKQLGEASTSGPYIRCDICNLPFLRVALISLGEIANSNRGLVEVFLCEVCARKASIALAQWSGEKKEQTVCLTEFAGLEMLKPLYAEMNNPEEIKHFLETHVFLMPALLEAPTQIKRFFLEEELRLEISASMGETLLTIYIKTTKEAIETYRLLVQFQDAWWSCCVSEEVKHIISIAPDCNNE